MNYVSCSSCGKRVSNYVNGEILVRAYIECPECIEKQNEVGNVPEADSVQPQLYEGWRDRSDKSYYNEKRILIFTPCYEDITMRWRIIDSQFMDLCTEASHWKKLDEPAFV